MDNPQFDGTAASREIHVGGSVVRVVSTGVHYRDHVVTLDEGSFRQQGRQFHLERELQRRKQFD